MPVQDWLPSFGRDCEMRFSWNNVVKAISLGASEAGIRILRSRVKGYIDPDTDSFTYLVASWFDYELKKIEKDVREDLRRLIIGSSTT